MIDPSKVHAVLQIMMDRALEGQRQNGRQAFISTSGQADFGILLIVNPEKNVAYRQAKRAADALVLHGQLKNEVTALVEDTIRLDQGEIDQVMDKNSKPPKPSPN